jgi:signal transduction histidine kinase/ActR/RegA family two-component response regulator
MLRTASLSVQLVATFVGLIVGTTAVLTTAAYRYSRASLEAEARRDVHVATQTREQALVQLFHLRQQRTEGLLASMQSLCGEPAGPGRLAWAPDCVQTLVDDFRTSERALGVLLTYRTRRISRSGAAVSHGFPDDGALAGIVRRPDGAIEYVMRTALGDGALTLQFGHQEVAVLFQDPSGLPLSGEVFLIDSEGHFLTPPRKGAAMLPPSDGAEQLLANCASGRNEIAGVDYRGINAIQDFRPLAALSGACIVARVDYDEAVAAAAQLRADLVGRGAWFVLLGALVSLIAAQWIAAPVRRLAMSARHLQTGRFDRPIPLAGPAEVRALGRAFNAMGNDLAELVAKEQAARREAEGANRSKDEFLATISHELRTPLTAILGWSHMLRSGQLAPDRMLHGLEVVERNARAQKQLIEDLLDVSRIAANRLRIVREPVRLADLVEAALDSVRPQAVAKGIEIETSLSDPALVLGDPRRLEQVVWNLAWNAVKFTQPSGHIRVELASAGRLATLAVSDTGVGISSAFLPYIFEWFRQADAKTQTQAGLGLGLGIVRHLVQLHGGSVRAESAGEGRGATFIVTLPIYKPVGPPLPIQRGVEPAGDAESDALDGVRVLLVEDDPDTRELLRLALERASASIEAVASAEHARLKIFATPPDVLVSDIRMPKEDGYALIRSLRAAGITTPAIAVTAYARPEDAAEAQAAGYQIHLAKPIDAIRLVEAVARLAKDGMSATGMRSSSGPRFEP